MKQLFDIDTPDEIEKKKIGRKLSAPPHLNPVQLRRQSASPVKFEKRTPTPLEKLPQSALSRLESVAFCSRNFLLNQLSTTGHCR